MSKEQLEEIKEPFANLETIKVQILKRKIQDGLDEFKNNKGQQWIELRLEEPLLEKLLTSIEQAERVQELSEAMLERHETVGKLIEENKRYREVIKELVAHRYTWRFQKEIARKALESESDGS